VGRGNGFISIPVYYDILFRLGVAREALLSESHVQFMEQLMHYAMRVEFKEISFEEQLSAIKKLLSGRIQNEKFYHELVSYLEQRVLMPMGNLGMPVPSLNRADVFLFILCDLPVSDQQIKMAIDYWYALHTSYLLMDDMCDYKSDKEDNEENSVIELGDEEAGFEKAFEILRTNRKNIQSLNPVLADFLEESMTRLYDFIP
jgi:hypothetical protein